MNMELLQSTPYLEQTYASRNVISLAVAEQFFTCFLSRQGWNDAWLTQGISSYLSGLHFKKVFGNNEYRHWIHQVDIKPKVRSLADLKFFLLGIGRSDSLRRRSRGNYSGR